MVSRTEVERKTARRDDDAERRRRRGAAGWTTALAAALLIGALVGGAGAGAALIGRLPGQIERSSATICSPIPRSFPRRWSGSSTREAAAGGRRQPRRARDAVRTAPGRAPRTATSCWSSSSIMPAAIAARAIPTSSGCCARIKRLKVVWRECRCSARTARPPPRPASPPRRQGRFRPFHDQHVRARPADRRRRSPQARRRVGVAAATLAAERRRAELEQQLSSSPARSAPPAPRPSSSATRCSRARSATRR